MPRLRPRKDLCADALIARIHRVCGRLFPRQPRTVSALMAGFALFSLKDPSLLAFDVRRTDETIRSIYHIDHIPSDTHLRRVLDTVDPRTLRSLFTDLFSVLQRGKGLEDMVFYDGHYLIANDGTTYFSSEEVHCNSCLTVEHRTGTTEYRHGFLGSALVHPDHCVVIPLCPEPILNTDGHTKNDCERNAGKRWLGDFRREHPHLKTILTEDALGANAPHLRDLAAHDVRFIIRIKEGSHAYLFSILRGNGTTAHEMTDAAGTRYRFRYQNDVSLNESSPDVRVGVIACEEAHRDGSVQRFEWVTDIPVSDDNVYTLMRGGRARWKIENETFNTLKNQGYQCEHNFGHGTEHLTTVFALLMMLAFLVDQIQQKLCPLFREAHAVCGSKRALWERMRSVVQLCIMRSYADILRFIVHGVKYDPYAT